MLRHVIAALTLITLARCGEVNSVPSQGVTAQIEAAVASRGDKLVISDLTDFAWDAFFVFAPYTPMSEIEKALGSSAPELAGNRLEMYDSFHLLVFRLENKTVRQEQLSRDVDFAKESVSKRFSPATAVFKVRRELGRVILTHAGAA